MVCESALADLKIWIDKLLIAGSKHCVRKVFLRCTHPNRHEALLLLNRTLAAGDWLPRNLSLTSIVVIRRLCMQWRNELQQTWAPQQWMQSTADLIEQLINQAVRPANETVAANAECIVFKDRAEMLACLVIDWRDGQVGARWWWKSLLPRFDGARSVVGAWIEAPEYVPAAWHLLVQRSRAIEFASSINAEQSQQMLKAVVQQYALWDLQAVIATEPLVTESARGWIADSYQDAHERFGASGAPWQRSAKEANDDSLLPEQKMLLGISLTLQRAPAVARTPGFAQAVQHWIETVSNGRRIVEPANANSQGRFDSDLATIAAIPKPIESKAEANQETFDCPGLVADSENPATAYPISYSGSSRDEAVSESEEQKVGSYLPGAVAVEHSTLADLVTVDSAVEPLLEASISTNFGGLFYLLNFGLFLELYGDITTPWVRDIPLGIWDFLALLGERLVGEELRYDPAWALLVQLAGRDEQTVPGGDCTMPDEWRMPAEWLRAFEGDDEWQWATSNRRLQIWHPAGFFVLDVPVINGDAGNQLADELQAYPGFGPPMVTRAHHRHLAQTIVQTGNSLHRWLDWLTLYARARLQRALGVSDVVEAGCLLCRSQAQVFVTATHLDVVYSLADLMVEIRLAGLDRDPGWIPTSGRIIRFHYD